MKKRNLVLLGTAAVLALSVAGTIGTVAVASAATSIDNGSGEATTKVTYQVADAWEITIPDTLVVGGAGGKVEAKNVKIEPGKTLTVTASSANTWHVKENGTDGTGIEYELKVEGKTYSDHVLEVTAGEATGEANLTATVKEDNNANYSTGNKEYSDTITFEASVA